MSDTPRRACPLIVSAPDKLESLLHYGQVHSHNDQEDGDGRNGQCPREPLCDGVVAQHTKRPMPVRTRMNQRYEPAAFAAVCPAVGADGAAAELA